MILSLRVLFPPAENGAWVKKHLLSSSCWDRKPSHFRPVPHGRRLVYHRLSPTLSAIKQGTFRTASTQDTTLWPCFLIILGLSFPRPPSWTSQLFAFPPPPLLESSCQCFWLNIPLSFLILTTFSDSRVLTPCNIFRKNFNSFKKSLLL